MFMHEKPALSDRNINQPNMSSHRSINVRAEEKAIRQQSFLFDMLSLIDNHS